MGSTAKRIAELIEVIAEKQAMRMIADLKGWGNFQKEREKELAKLVVVLERELEALGV